jgi:hypothetical protein
MSEFWEATPKGEFIKVTYTPHTDPYPLIKTVVVPMPPNYDPGPQAIFRRGAAA